MTSMLVHRSALRISRLTLVQEWARGLLLNPLSLREIIRNVIDRMRLSVTIVMVGRWPRGSSGCSIL